MSWTPSAHELHRAGAPIKLRRKVFQVLAYLLAHRDRVVPKQELLEHLWPDQFVGDETLKSCIKTLRKALGERGRTPRFVRTLHGQGYRFVAAVEVREHLPGGRRAARPRPAAGEREPPARPRGHHLPCAAPLADLGSPPWQALDGEHKQVTVLCGALAEAPTLAARLGPEAMYHLMHDVLALAQDTVQRYEGTLLQVSGEGFLALFGAPVAQEDHARRAVLAALELRQRLRVPRGAPGAAARRGGPPGAAHRAGGGRAPGARPAAALHRGGRHPPPGDAAPAAGRARHPPRQRRHLCAGAGRGAGRGVRRPSRSTRRPTPVPVYVVHGLLRRRAGVPRRGARPLSRFVGRTRELALLHERLAQAAGGQGQVIGIAGEPGLGKSRLLAEFAHSLARAAGDLLRGPLSGLWQRHPVPAGARPAPAALGPPRRRPR